MKQKQNVRMTKNSDARPVDGAKANWRSSAGQIEIPGSLQVSINPQERPQSQSWTAHIIA
jgi:hypothetical protein